MGWDGFVERVTWYPGAYCCPDCKQDCFKPIHLAGHLMNLHDYSDYDAGIIIELLTADLFIQLAKFAKFPVTASMYMEPEDWTKSPGPLTDKDPFFVENIRFIIPEKDWYIAGVGELLHPTFPDAVDEWSKLPKPEGATYHMPNDLYEHQRKDLKRLLRETSSFMNLSEMGTGKTPVAIGLSLLGEYRKTLIICSKTLQLEWARQIEEWTGKRPALARRSSGSRRLEALFSEELGLGEESPFFVINYESFRAEKFKDVLNVYPFDLIIMDEGHRIRNPKTRQTKGLFEFLRNQSDVRRLVITGSPIVNNPADLHTLLCIVRPHEYELNSRLMFLTRWSYFKRTRFGIKVTETRDMDILRAKTDPYTVRHTKKEVLEFLPDKYYRRAELEMEMDQRLIYEQLEDELFVELDSGEKLSAPSVLALLTRLRQVNLDPKILGIDVPSSKTDFVDTILEEYEENGDEEVSPFPRKLVIFSCFKKYIQILDERIKIPHITIHGEIPADNRMEEIQRFQNDPSVKIALGTIQCMGEGITLTAASDVIMTDRWWTPAQNRQAEDRLHRIGAKNAVQVIIPVNLDSVDQALDGILAKKAALSDGYLGMVSEDEVMSDIIDDLRSFRAKRAYAGAGRV